MQSQMPIGRDPVPRYVPEWALPAYAFVPGLWPHPRRPGGHAHGIVDAETAPLLSDQPRACRAFLRGLDLFNHGYYWEAHEAWEGLWRDAQEPAQKALLQGLIRLAACGVKLRQGLSQNVCSHAQAAQALFARAQKEAGHNLLCGLDLPLLQALAQQAWTHRAPRQAQAQVAVQVVFAQPLRLREGSG